MKEIIDLVDRVKANVIRWRRHIHQYPELSHHEENTSQFIYETLQTFGNLELSRPTQTSVMARLIGTQPGKVLAIRADIDALPIHEENNYSYASVVPNVMHACGHDGHLAMLLGTAEVLSALQEKIRGEVRFFFQHAEETIANSGAEEMIQAGVMDGVDMVIGGHLWAMIATGKFGVSAGPVMAAPDTFQISIIGRGGHGAYPQQSVDPIAIGAQVVINLQHIVSREIDPLDQAVVSVCKFHSGTQENIIPVSAEISGTVRTFNTRVREQIPKRMERIVKGITEAHGISYEFKYQFGSSPVVNDEEVTRIIRNTVVDVFGEKALNVQKPTMGGEDFSAYQLKAPGTFIIIGARNFAQEMVYPHHHPRFTIDEDALTLGVRLFVEATFRLLD